MIFFGENGLTSTSANFVANMAKEYVDRLQTEFENLKLINADIEVIGTDAKSRILNGSTSLSDVNAKLNTIAKCHSLMAWLREAIKAKRTLAEDVKKTTFESLTGRPFTEEPKETTYLCREDVLAEMDVERRNKMLSLEAFASVFGQFVHPSAPLSKARKEMNERLAKPIECNIDGQNTLITHYSPSMAAEEVEAKFFEIQGLHRDYQSQLNKIESEITNRLLEDKLAKDAAYQKACEEWAEIHRAETAQLTDYVNKKAIEINNLKIVIPPSLMDIYHTIQGLGK